MHEVAPERPREAAILAGVSLPGEALWDEAESLQELSGLAVAAGAQVVGRVTQHRPAPDPAYYLGRGKVEAIRGMVEETGADMVIFDDDLSPGQARNLEELLGRRVLDRTELILDIFAQRARTGQAKIQVELAQLHYLLPRLTRMWRHLSRIRGGIGLRGPGEQQLEVDRRVIRRKVVALEKKLAAVQRRRHVQRLRRREQFNAALVGYTNAGKSTLFNALAGCSLPTGDRFFATLDATTRVVVLDDEHRLLLTDTVGFIRKLPHHLVASFRATLEEVVEADLLLHIVDIGHPRHGERMEVVEGVLGEIGALGRPTIPVFNKVDCARDAALLAEARRRWPEGIFLSATRPETLPPLRERLRAALGEREVTVDVLLDAGDSRMLAELYAEGTILERRDQDGGMRVRVRMERQVRDRLLKRGLRLLPGPSPVGAV